MEPPKSSPTPVPAISCNEATPAPTTIREQLERILESSFFRKSKRYSAFLRYSVERVLAGQSEFLKERTVGIEVFGRPADYNTAVDHIVRSAAGEIRKRLAQYYADPATSDEVRIDLPPGSYVPHFGSLRHEPFEIKRDSAPTAQPPTSRKRTWHWAILAGAVSVSLAITAFVSNSLARDTVLNVFWAPILSSREPVTLCVGSPPDRDSSSDPEAGRTAAGMDFARSNRVSFASATTLAKLSGLLQSHGKQYQVMLQSATKFSDLQRGPSVLIGGFNNGWTMRLSSTLRFGFERYAGHPRIRDRQNPSRSDWSVDWTLRNRQITRDYAIVSRLQDPKTEQTTVIVAGIAHWGTVAAGEFITDSRQMEKLLAAAPRHWEHMNMQVVLSTDVIDEISGSPKIVASRFW